jgi:hypothetical protein
VTGPRTTILRPTSATVGLPPTFPSASASVPATGVEAVAVGAAGVVDVEGDGAAASAAAAPGAAAIARSAAQSAAGERTRQTIEARGRRIRESYAPGRARPGSGAIRPMRLNASTSSAIATSALTISTGACQPQFSRLENASELFSECAAMHGYSDPV